MKMITHVSIYTQLMHVVDFQLESILLLRIS
jgi:hypothetical protein